MNLQNRIYAAIKGQLFWVVWLPSAYVQWKQRQKFEQKHRPRTERKSRKMWRKCNKVELVNQPKKKNTRSAPNNNKIKQSSRVRPYVKQRLIKQTAIIPRCSWQLVEYKKHFFVFMCFHSEIFVTRLLLRLPEKNPNNLCTTAKKETLKSLQSRGSLTPPS